MVESSQEDESLHHGEAPGSHHVNILNLAHQLIEKFPDLREKRRYKVFIGTSVMVAPLLVTLATMVVTNRLREGHSIERILREVSSEEIENARAKKLFKKVPTPSKFFH